MSESVFSRLNRINVNDHTEKKGLGRNALSYLSWAWAWAEVKKAYPRSYYTIYEAANGCIYHTDGRTCWVKTGVTIVDGEWKQEHIEYLPVMNNSNGSISLEEVTSVAVNKTIQRSLTKACARHGLGLYIYAGEDLPEDDQDGGIPPDRQPQGATAQKTSTVYSPKAEIDRIKTHFKCDDAGFAKMRVTLIAGGVIPDKPSKEMTETDWKQLFSAIWKNFGDGQTDELDPYYDVRAMQEVP